ncbi:MAG: phosphoribosylanthranilate isomerase [Gammaproteobacteria bacterium]|nr:phosphoribosylanthranilate isomerase [Gammaproteobacteria bacterium]
MSIWVKICGLTDAAAIEAVVQASVQAAGFVFADSPRKVAPTVAAGLAQQLTSDIATVAVFLRPTQAQVDEVLQDFHPDYVQADWSALAELDLPESVMLLPVLREGQNTDRQQLPSRFLFEGVNSGAGETVDWQQAAVLGRHGDLILAGGLDPANVRNAIKVARPFGVDVSSGVENAPGSKDPERIMEFVNQVRTQ